MTFDEAVAILQIDPEHALDPTLVRGAYLRAIKQHKPESDPAGFKRVRAAYELLLAHRQLVTSLGEGRAEVPATSPDAPPPPAAGAPEPEALDLVVLRRRLQE